MVESLGSRLKALRQSNRLRQDQVASLVGVSKNAMCSYESDVRQPSYETLIRLATIYRVSTDYLLGCQGYNSIDITGLSGKDVDFLKTVLAFLVEKNKSPDGME